MRLFNVRLGPADARMAAQLRNKGLRLSDLVRAAIRAAHERQAAAAGSRKPREIMATIYRDHPDPAGRPRKRVDLRDRRRVRRAIRKRLRRRG